VRDDIIEVSFGLCLVDWTAIALLDRTTDIVHKLLLLSVFEQHLGIFLVIRFGVIYKVDLARQDRRIFIFGFDGGANLTGFDGFSGLDLLESECIICSLIQFASMQVYNEGSVTQTRVLLAFVILDSENFFHQVWLDIGIKWQIFHFLQPFVQCLRLWTGMRTRKRRRFRTWTWCRTRCGM